MSDFAINPVVSGLKNAMMAAQMMQRMALQRELLARAKHREEREQALHEFDLEQRLLTGGAKPVEPGGTYEQTIRNPEGGFMQTRPPVAPERTLSARLGGRQRQYYIPTPQERKTEELASRLEEIRSLGDIERQLTVAKAQALLPVQREAAQVEVPGFGTVDKAAIPVIASREEQAAAGARQTSQQVFAAGESTKLRQTQKEVAQIRTTGRDATSANQRRLARRDQLNEFDDLVASEVVRRAGAEADDKAIRASLDQVVGEDKTGQVKPRYLSILRKAKSGAIKPKTMGQMTPQEFAAEMEKWATGEGAAGAPATGKPAAPAKPKPGTAAELIAELEGKKRRAQKR